ncbi:hypothetical protein [Streptomyces silvensis]|uniref:WXG100 family type VII secretion target n=1 Tax=Streptomyces silvensis TaxID=1765722 RepID=A0A0W7X2R1_9ACTN|nr:hypothetical protein [Streptomyces silvensis]KUF17134.1 hypothetical protein AT728_14825 [Streptomyces silvensis]
MLSYYEAMTTDFGSLSAAADKWQEMAEEFDKVEGRYRDGVQKIAQGQAWLGESARAAHARFAATRYEYQAAQTQARATATLLRNAHQQFVDLRKQLETARADAVEAGMKVSEEGKVAFDYDRLSASESSAARLNPARAASINVSVDAWADFIKLCVKAFDDADQDLKRDLEAVVKDGKGNKNDRTAGTGFNGDADQVAKADRRQKRARDDSAWFEKRDDETLDDYMERLRRDGVTRLTGSAQLGELVSAVTSGTMTAGAFAAATGTSVLYSVKLLSHMRTGKEIHAPGTFVSRFANTRLAGAAPGSLLSRFPPGAVTALTGSDEAAMFGGFMRNGTYVMPSASEANLIRVARGGGFAQAGRAAGWIRGAGVVGGGAATAYGIANLATYDGAKIRADPSKFASDLSGTAFSGSMTALTVAPNPVTLGVALGAGAVYGGALIWDNHEALGKGIGEAKDWVGDRVEGLGSGMADGAKKFKDVVNPFD